MGYALVKLLKMGNVKLRVIAIKEMSAMMKTWKRMKQENVYALVKLLKMGNVKLRVIAKEEMPAMMKTWKRMKLENVYALVNLLKMGNVKKFSLYSLQLYMMFLSIHT